MEGRKCRAAQGVSAAATLSLALSALPVEGGGNLAAHTRLRTPIDRMLLAEAVEGAERRLGKPECQGLVDEFADVDGHPLREALEAEEATAAQFVGRLYFFEGSESGCRRRILAYTEPRSRIVFVCTARFRKVSERNRAYVEAAIIHETLHTLGLGENPPTWEEITERVLALCR